MKTLMNKKQNNAFRVCAWNILTLVRPAFDTIISESLIGYAHEDRESFIKPLRRLKT